ncbi:DUF6340 family protein [Thermophagus xiamenensis]|uniref:Uncharacterized protein n=1 Tax=Thermophagus xiamenensis TaxID=385682 RepID=A0A1I2EB04_9BACT|nr:DUF6340 family protein [Thermophagus xiamenensis]SFE90035.1 hypothetical protein SAMN05444380_12210 [Thermophagus xiamenensis]
MYRIKNWFYFVIALLFSGCVSYSTIGIDVLKPAGVEIPVEIASVVLVDNSPGYFKSDTGIHKIILPGRRAYTVDTIRFKDFGKVAVLTLAEALKDKAFFDSVYVYPGKPVSNSRDKNNFSLSEEVVDSLCNRFNAQGVISLDYYDYNTVLRVDKSSELYYSTLDARSRTRWTIYNGLNGGKVDVYVQRDTIFWDAADYSMNSSVAHLPQYRDALKMAAQNAGVKYADYVAPSWELQSRRFYIKGHPLFYKASEMVSEGKWEEAGRIWYYVYQNGKGKQKARAAFNLALSKEMQGDFLEAAAWAWKGLEEYQNLKSLSANQAEKDFCKFYYMLLARRMQEKKKLDAQYGVEQ